MKHYYINAHYGYGKDAFENFAQVEILHATAEPTDCQVRAELHAQGSANKSIRSLEWMIFEEETA